MAWVSKGPEQLDKEVLQAGWCLSCGACVNICPYYLTRGAEVVLIEPCGLSEGACYNVCPRTPVPSQLFEGSRDIALGSYRDIFWAKSKDPEILARAQYGGVTTTLIDFAIREGEMEGAVLARTSPSDPLLPQGVLAKDREAVLSCAGSKYVGAPTLAELNRAIKDGVKRVAFVGRPCQVLALRRRQLIPDGEPLVPSLIGLVIGLFCFWALSYKPFKEYLSRQLEISAIRKVDIPPGEVVVYGGDGELGRFPVDEVRPFALASCAICPDVTSELSDISIGSTERDYDFCTVIVRSEAGQHLIDRVASAGRLEIRRPPEDYLELLRRVVLNKKRRAFKAMEEHPYLTLTALEKEAIVD